MARGVGARQFVQGGRMAGLKSIAGAIKSVTGGEGPALTERLAALKRLTKAVSSGEYRGVSGTQVALMTAAAAYIASPIDLLPEGLLGVLGVADDAVVLAWFASTLVRVTDDFLAWERSRDTTVMGERTR